MYENNTIARRRPSGWVERRRYFRRKIEQARTDALKTDEKTQKVEPDTERN
jgi:hypothetical protein